MSTKSLNQKPAAVKTCSLCAYLIAPGEATTKSAIDGLVHTSCYDAAEAEAAASQPKVSTPAPVQKPRPDRRGTPGACERIARNTWKVPSWTNPRASYLVDLAHSTCNCESRKPCKHIAQARAANHQRLVEIAATLEDHELTRALAVQEACGNLVAAFAIRCELFDREQVAQ